MIQALLKIPVLLSSVSKIASEAGAAAHQVSARRQSRHRCDRHAEVMPSVDYELIAFGRSLADAVQQLAQWAVRHRSTIHDNRLRYDARR